jgi:SAM-dependent methyltransferase
MTGYIFDNAAEGETATRFGSLDAIYNPRTFRFLEATGIRAGWTCLEIGGGSGAVAAWMAERVGTTGSVLLTDIEPRFIEASGRQHLSNVELRRHDIAADPLPASAFDLVHARLVLSHVPQRQSALDKLVAALKPQGYLVIEEFDPRLVDRGLASADPVAADCFRRVIGALGRLMDERGFSADWGRVLYARLRAAGLTGVGMEGHIAVRPGGSAGAHLDAANIAQVRDSAVRNRLVTDAEVDAVLSSLEDPEFAVFSPVMFTAWGQRAA